MSPDEALFYEALERGNAAAAYLDQACAGDHDLRQRVERLLAAHQGADSLLDEPANVAVATCDVSPTISERAGHQIGPYKLIQQIGEGGMGVVYMAQQTEPVKRLVALKIIKPGMDSRQVIARFEAERQALALMDHPNIAKVLDAGTTDSGRPYFVMELVKGIPITTYCDEKRLTPRQRLELFVPVCHAVQHAHQKGIIHRDLKPSNVMTALYDGRPVPKVIDFGVAKATGGQLTEKTLVTNFGSLVGTIEYMSPEQAELNQLDVDTRSDIYSLGVLLYELLTGSTPLDREQLRTATFHEKLRMIREDEAETVSNRIARTRRVGSAHQMPAGGHSPPHVSAHAEHDGTRSVPATYAELDWIVFKALEKDRSRRYEAAASLAADIQRYLNDEPVQACPPSTLYRFQKFTRKHKPALATAAAIALCLLLGTTISAWQAVRATAAETQATANEAKAQASAQRAEEKAQEATTQRDDAQKQRDEVRALADQLAAKEQQLQRTLYNAHMNLAQRAWDADQIDRVNELLEKHRPKPGQFDHRGFEWHYLYKLCHPELLMFPGNAVAYSPDGEQMAIVTNDGLKILDAQTSRELLSINERGSSVAFSPDGKRLAAAQQVKNTVKVWDAQTGKELHAFKGHDKEVWQVAFSPDGKRLASVGDGKSVIVRDSETGEEIFAIEGRGHIWCVALSPDGKRLATAGDEGLVIVWDAQTGRELVSLKKRSSIYPAGGTGMTVAFSPDGKRVASNYFDKTEGDFRAKIWDAESGEELVTCKGGPAFTVAFSPDGKRLASAAFGQAVKVWDAETGDELFSFVGNHRSDNKSLTFNPDGTRLASVDRPGTVKVYDVGARQTAPAYSKTRFRDGNVVAFSPDGKRVTGVSWDPMAGEHAIKLWDAKTGQEILTLRQTDWPRVVTFSPDGKWLAAGFGAWDKNKGYQVAGEVKVWDAETGREFLTFKGHTAAVVGLAFSPDGTRVASSSSQAESFSAGSNVVEPGQPGEVVVWDARSGQELLTLKGHRRFVDSVAFSPDGSRLATLSRDDSVKVWDAQTGQELLSLRTYAQEAGGSVAFSPDGKRLANSHVHSYIKIWNAQTGEQLLTLQGRKQSHFVARIAFSPDGSRIACGQAYGANELKLWDTHTGEELLTFEKTGSGGVAFSPDGHRLAAAGPEGLRILDATPLSNP